MAANRFKRQRVAACLALTLAVAFGVAQVNADASENEDARRLKRGNNRLRDPRNVEMKPTLRRNVATSTLLQESNVPGREHEAHSPWELPLHADQFPRPLNILALGGSVTWGTMLDDRFTEAYPHLIGGFNRNMPANVDNLAMRATGADYPSICLESMIEKHHGSTSSADAKNYDVILFDFVMNGTNGFPKLLRRLRTRYPQAIIVYVHIWSVKFLAVEAETGRTVMQTQNDPSLNYVWSRQDTFDPEHCNREVCSAQEMESLVKSVGGIVWKLPLPPTPRHAIESGWFAKDWHHLSAKGHSFMAQSILDLLYEVRGEVFREKQLGSFGKGDDCHNWFQSGEIDAAVGYDHAKAVNLLGDGPAARQKAPEYQKWTLQTELKHPSTVTFESPFDFPVPIGLAYMSQHFPARYPIVDVTVTKGDGSIPIDNMDSTTTPATTRRINPSQNHLQDDFPAVHITVFSHIGMAHPGTNTIAIEPLLSAEQTRKARNPFRIVGLYLCGDCVDDMGTDFVMGHGAIPSELVTSHRLVQPSL